MHKITGPAVSAHRAAQRAALIHAGEEVLLDAGLPGFSPGSVTARAGIARSTFYDYFPSKDDLLVAISIAAMERWNAEIEEEMGLAEPGVAQLRAFVSATMRMTADGKHELAGIVREADLAPSAVADLMVLHDVLFRPAIRVLTGLGMQGSSTFVALVHGVLGAGVELVGHGAQWEKVSDDVFNMLTRGLVN